jgi:DNA-binding transcriptional ArsR family regulator
VSGDADRKMADLLAAMTNPVRLAIVDHLTVEPATATYLAAEFEIPVEKVRYHLKRLRQAGMVKVHEKRERRGAIEHVYITDNRELVFDGKEMADYLAPRQSRYHQKLLKIIFQEAIGAIRSGAFHERDDFAVIRIPMELDSQGVEEVSEILEAALQRLLGLREESLTRLEGRWRDSRPATSAFLFFETSAD